MGAPVINCEVKGAIKPIVAPLQKPQLNVAMIKTVLTSDPVIYTEAFFRNWVKIHSAKSNAVLSSVFTLIFKMNTSFFYIISRISNKNKMLFPQKLLDKSGKLW